MTNGKTYEPTDQERQTVEAMTAYGITEAEIAKIIGIAPKTLRKHFQQERENGASKANSKVAQFLYHAASGKALKDGASHSDCLKASMFWAKTRMQWRETNHYEHTSPDGTMSPKPAIDARQLSDTALEEILDATNAETDE